MIESMRQIKSLCPHCLDVIDASISEKYGKMMIEKVCSKHGYFDDIYWSDIIQFKRFEKYWYDGNGLNNPNISESEKCPNSCGICESHRTTSILANIDVTNRAIKDAQYVLQMQNIQDIFMNHQYSRLNI